MSVNGMIQIKVKQNTNKIIYDIQIGFKWFEHFAGLNH